ncbi:MAG: hypothetical protein WC824_01700 [Bacteroidota bacterium]|jgi:hypothetical protein
MQIDFTRDEPLSAYFAFAVKFSRARARQLIGIVLLIGLPAIVMDMAGSLLDQPAFRHLTWLSLTLKYCSDFLFYFAWPCVVLILAGYISDEKLRFRDFRFRSGGRLLKGFLSFSLVFLVNTGGLLILVLLLPFFSGGSPPHPLLMLVFVVVCALPIVWLSFFPFLVLIEKQPMSIAVRTSVRQVQQHWTGVAGMLIYLSALGLLVSALVWFGNSAISNTADSAFRPFQPSSFSSAAVLAAIPRIPLLLLEKGTTLFLVTVFSFYFINSRIVWSDLERSNEEDPSEGTAEAAEPYGDPAQANMMNRESTQQND